MHKRTTGNDFSKERKWILQAPRIFREGAKVRRMLFFPHFRAEGAGEDPIRHFIRRGIWASGPALCMSKNGIPKKKKNPGSRNACHLNFISSSLSLFRAEMGFQAARNEPVQQKDCLLHHPRHFTARIPDSIRMHKLTTGNDFPPQRQKSIS
ncbi:hypothetical protein CDAR_88991 [Caerostris darwini]|uniref:Uncharacterized protein n=1 Tax=Caerostris darwini TaxID=1538125 RepID=A0AAV4V0X8_9ARAC|nr:hypothetical protein CDAR_88991 [Caerostris darwini]